MAYIHEHAEKVTKKCAMCALDNDTPTSFCKQCLVNMGRGKMNINWGTLNEAQYFRNIYYLTKSEKDKLEGEVMFLRKRKSELDAELKRYIEANDKLDKKANDKYWEGFSNGKKEALNTPGQVFKCEFSNRGSEAYLDGFKAGIEWLNGVLKK